MTLIGVIALILRYFTEFGIASGAHCVKLHVRYLIYDEFLVGLYTYFLTAFYIGKKSSY